MFKASGQHKHEQKYLPKVVSYRTTGDRMASFFLKKALVPRWCHKFGLLLSFLDTAAFPPSPIYGRTAKLRKQTLGSCQFSVYLKRRLISSV
jgi:hypothetical protein